MLLLISILGNDNAALAQAPADSSYIINNIDTAIDSLANADSTPKVDTAVTPTLLPKSFDTVARKVVPLHKHYPTALFYFICLLALILGIVRLLDSSIYQRLFSLHFATASGVQMLRDKFNSYNLPMMLLLIASLLGVTVFIYLFIALYTGSGTMNLVMQPMSMLRAFGIVIGLLLFRLLVVSIFGYFFNHYTIASASRLQIVMTFILIGICSIPMSVIMAFTHVNIGKLVGAIGIFLFILLIGISLLRMIKPLGNTLSQNKFHFFLYLCTAEIVPLGLLVKYISNNFV